MGDRIEAVFSKVRLFDALVVVVLAVVAFMSTKVFALEGKMQEQQLAQVRVETDLKYIRLSLDEIKARLPK